MDEEPKSPADRLERALRDLEARKKAAAERAAQGAPDAARLEALHAQIAALPQHERRAVLDAAGMHRVSAAPEPIKPIRGGGFVSEPSSQPVRWAVWRALPHAQLWQAVALSLNLEPIQAMLDQAGRAPSRYRHPGLPAEFLDRLEVCQRALSTAGPIKPQGDLYPGMLQSPRCAVLVSEVAAFLVLAEFTVPDEMRQTTPPVTGAVSPVAASLPAAVTEVEESKRTHKLRRRADALAAVLNEAKKKAPDPNNWQSVWASLVVLAQSASRPPPLLGYTEGEGVKYQTDDAEKPDGWLTREAYRRRFERQP